MSSSLPSLMSPLAIALLALSMSMDAFAVSVGRGTALTRPQFSEALRTGFVFGTVEGAMPVVGWFLGLAASSFVQSVDHWIAFGLLSVVGLRMAWAAWHEEAEDIPAGTSLASLAAMAVGTSLDSMAVGVSLAFLKVNIAVVALSIGFSTFVMSSGGLMIGRLIGEKCGRAAAVAAGLFLVGLGAFILWRHIG